MPKKEQLNRYAICRPIAAQFISTNLIALFELEQMKRELRIGSEKHYFLTEPTELTGEEIAAYSRRGNQ
jgi:hypothetical protein